MNKSVKIMILAGMISVQSISTIGMVFGEEKIETKSNLIKNTNQVGRDDSKTINVEFRGIEDQSILVGDTFNLNEGVQILENGKNVTDYLVIENSSGQRVSGNVKIPDLNTYTYIYKYLDSNNKLHEKKRTIKGIHTEASANIKLIKENEIELKYDIKNNYNKDIDVKLEDWALFPKNHKENLGTINPNQSKELVRKFNIVPGFKESSDVPDGPIEGNNSDNPKHNTIYLPEDSNLGFAPNFFISDINGNLINSFNLNIERDFIKLKNDMKSLSDKVNIKAVIENKNVKVGDKVKIKYEIENNSDKPLNFKVESWTYFGKYNEIELGEVNPGNKNLIEKEIIITNDMIDKYGKLKSDVQGYHIYSNLDELFVKKYNVTFENSKVIIHNKYINGYPDNTFRQENNITRGELVAMLTRTILDGKPVPVTENKFNDISNDYWAKNEVNFLASKGILIGYEDGTFRPENPITRAEIATMIVRANSDIKQILKKAFPDVDDSHWAKKYIEKASELGYMIGYDDGSFKPDQGITRGETVVTLNRIYRNPCDFKDIDSSKLLFKDIDKNNWAYNDIVKATVSHEHSENK